MAAQRQYHVGRLLLIGLVFHVVFILSVFDCYFTSPVVHGMQNFKTSKAQSKRLVLIVGDGLRADLLFEKNGFPPTLFSQPDIDRPEIVAPHLRSIVETRGAFGVSHTRVPTESRPGHVSIIGGMYEDVSAVTKGWKTNPVDFDSVFNQSSTTFSFGSPDILPMFARGATPGKVKTWTYDEEDEDFTKDATALDIWVLDRLKDLFQNSTSDSLLHSQLHTDGTIFFLHLLGLDTTGHSYRPHSLEYMHNIQVVDNIVHETEKLFSSYFGDEETSFVFTADHGMSVIGNHGDGNPDNTRTPLVAWGKGVRGPLPDQKASSHDDYSATWGLEHVYRRDVEQADIAPLMSTLLGINLPVNSVGVLPDANPDLPGYLTAEEGEGGVTADAALVNVKVLLENYLIQHAAKQARTFFYKPFPPLEAESIPSGLPLRSVRLAEIQDLINKQEWHQAKALASELISTTLSGLRYVQTYERSLIGAIVTIAYLGWGAYASLYVFRPELPSNVSSYLTVVPTSFSVATLAGFWIMFALQRSPWTYYLYVLFPAYFWREFFVNALPTLSSRESIPTLWKVGIRSLAVFLALQGMVAGYTHRSLWSIGFLLMAVVWPLLSWSTAARSQMGLYRFAWPIACAISAVFPLLSVDKTESLISISLGGFVILAASEFYRSWVVIPALPDGQRRSISLLLNIESLLLILSMVVTASSVRSLQAKAGLPLLNQVAGWIILVSASLLPFVWPHRYPSPDAQLLAYFLGLGSAFVILSISVEGLFYASFAALLACWIPVEHVVRQDRKPKSKSARDGEQGLQADDLRIALFFLFFVQVGFFGTGNVASISSFYLAPVYRLIPIFNPFFMASLLMFKIVVPYITLSAMFATLNYKLSLPPFSLFLVALAVMDGMTLTFFFNVTDTGSWLEIGQTISFFCITSLLLLWSAGICAAGEYLMKGSFEFARIKVA